MIDCIEISFEPWDGCFRYDDLKPYYLKHDEDKYYFSHNLWNEKIYVPDNTAEEIFETLQKLDYMKILHEASQIRGCDGSRTLIKLSMGKHDLTIALWAFNYKSFSEFTESRKLVSIYKQIEKLAAEVNFNITETKKAPTAPITNLF